MGARLLNVTFHGVRGSTPCSGPSTEKYGGNTSCVSVTTEGQQPILFDLGTGLRYFGKQFANLCDGALRATALVTHLHWDHVQGLPFFTPMLKEGSHLSIYGPLQSDGSSFQSAMENAVSPPTFPVNFDAFPGTFEFHSVANDEFTIGEFTVTSRNVPHTGITVGYRLDFNGKSVAYISDHQQPLDGTFDFPDSVRELVNGVDLLIHDSQYTPQEFALKANWGHCTPEFAIRIGAECGAKKVVLFHHDPERTDAELDAIIKFSESCGVEVVAAAEGLTITL